MKNYAVYLLVLMIIGMSMSCHKYIVLYNGNLYLNSFKEEFINMPFDLDEEYKIPSRIIKTLEKEFDDNFEFATSDETYNKTDIHAFPNKKLLLVGINKSQNYGFIYYEKGGIWRNHYLINVGGLGRTIRSR